jgi:hypothetical protein
MTIPEKAIPVDNEKSPGVAYVLSRSAENPGFVPL